LSSGQILKPFVKSRFESWAWQPISNLAKVQGFAILRICQKAILKMRFSKAVKFERPAFSKSPGYAFENSPFPKSLKKQLRVLISKTQRLILKMNVS
jgi:hypothetical protein